VIARPARLAWILWLAFSVGVTALVVLERERRSVTPVYREATQAWLAHRPLYGEGIHGFLYLPSAALLYVPFTWPPGLWGGVVWRAVGLVVLATGAWRLAALGGGGRERRFLVLTVLTLPILASSARNGQMNVPMAGLMAHAAVDLAAAAWWRAAAGLSLALALKPTVLPFALLAVALHLPVSWRFGVLTAVVLALPFAAAEAAYVGAQYAGFVEKLRIAGAPPPGRWQDVTGIPRALGYEPPAGLMTALRVGAAAATLALAWLARRRFSPDLGAVFLLALGAGYILLWNPRTEGVTYLILAPALGVLADRALAADRRSAAGWLCVAVAGVLAVSHLLTPGKYNPWMRPAVTLVFLAYVVGLVLRSRSPDSTAPA
jgi:alpha-1,2-mannosyltransferase